jgi:AraC-like DNA-binding protein
VGRDRPAERVVPARVADRPNIERFIDAHIERHDLGPRLVARHFGLSERQLYRVTTTMGCTPAALIWSRRLERARGLLDAEPGSARVLDVALRCGFKDGAHFSRAFRRAFGRSPRESRAGARLAVAGAASTGF